MFTASRMGTLIDEVVDVLEHMTPQIARIPGISDATLTEVESAIDDLKNATSMLLVTPSHPHATAPMSPDTITRIEQDAAVILGALASLPMPAPVALGFRVASMLLPALIAAAKLVVSQRQTA